MTSFKQAYKFITDNKIVLLQRPKEINWLFNKVKHLKDVSIFVEIGNGHGASAYILGRAMPEGSKIILIDKNHPDLRKTAVDALKDSGYDVLSMFGKSGDYITRKVFLKNLMNKEIDFLFIDGDHTLDGVKSDFEFYSRFVKKGGLIALHDIAKHPTKKDIQVWKLWKELKEQYQTLEYIEPKNHVGVGVIKV